MLRSKLTSMAAATVLGLSTGLFAGVLPTRASASASTQASQGFWDLAGFYDSFVECVFDGEQGLRGGVWTDYYCDVSAGQFILWTLLPD